MDEHELAWAAGFFDGDGWAALVRFGRATQRRPFAQINQSSLTGVPQVLVRFRDAVGVGRVAGPKIEEGREPLYRWVASSRDDVLRTGTVIGPWLSHEKREQFSVAVRLRFEMKPIDSFAWAAGLFDAEGCIALRAPNPSRVQGDRRRDHTGWRERYPRGARALPAARRRRS